MSCFNHLPVNVPRNTSIWVNAFIKLNKDYNELYWRTPFVPRRAGPKDVLFLIDRSASVRGLLLCHIVNFEFTGWVLSYCKFCIYTHPVNSKLTIWLLYGTSKRPCWYTHSYIRIHRWCWQKNIRDLQTDMFLQLYRMLAHNNVEVLCLLDMHFCPPCLSILIRV